MVISKKNWQTNPKHEAKKSGQKTKVHYKLINLLDKTQGIGGTLTRILKWSGIEGGETQFKYSRGRENKQDTGAAIIKRGKHKT